MNIRFQTVGPCFTPATHRYYDGSDSCLPSPRLTGLPACLATPARHCASNHVMYPSIALHAITQRTGRVSGFALEEQARRHIPPKRVRHPAHCQFALRLLPTPPHSDAVTFGYRVLACPDTDLHRADVAPSRSHSSRRRPGSMLACAATRRAGMPASPRRAGHCPASAHTAAARAHAPLPRPNWNARRRQRAAALC